MDDVPKIAIGAAVLGGYALGRTKKGRVAFAMATYLAGRRFGLEPQQLLAEGVKRLRELPQFADLDEQIRGQALDAGRKALSAVADRKLADLADSLHQRTERIGKGKEEPQGEDEEPEDEYEEEEEPQEEHEEGEEPEDEHEEEDEEEEPEEEPVEEEEPRLSAPQRRRSARKPDEDHDGSARRGRGRERRPEETPARKAPAKKATPSKKRAAKKTSAARKSTSPPKRTVTKRTAAKTTASKKTPAKKTTAHKASSRRQR
ncbi:histone protein [Actinacidiphila glaucinigra]|uniref:histone protein n=1 Tax=Actinacidiphila glaucinigra TaxID=235986 RepID=UPI0033AF8998